MTLTALTDCCRLLAIDGKTLRRWLAQAQLPVQAHPSDARCKGLSSDHLLLLARAHHRSLAGLPQELAAPACPTPPEEPPALLAELLALLPTLTVLPAQTAAGSHPSQDPPPSRAGGCTRPDQSVGQISSRRFLTRQEACALGCGVTAHRIWQPGNLCRDLPQARSAPA